jgi:hypothetical protein
MAKRSNSTLSDSLEAANPEFKKWLDITAENKEFGEALLGQARVQDALDCFAQALIVDDDRDHEQF